MGKYSSKKHSMENNEDFDNEYLNKLIEGLSLANDKQLSLDLEDTDTDTNAPSWQHMSNNASWPSLSKSLTSTYTTTTNGTQSISSPWYGTGTSPYWSIGTTNSASVYPYTTTNNDIHVDDVKLKGKSLSETLENIEKRLNILRVNPELESKWEELKELGDRYRALEADIIEKQKIWDVLKK